jgi:hypothetical protein
MRQGRQPLAIHLLAGRLHENVDPYAVAAGLQLPIPAYVRFASPQHFLDDPAAGMAPMARHGITNYYVGLRPLVLNLPKFRNEAPMAAGDVAAYIADSVPAEHRGSYNLRVAEYVVATCGMVMILNPSGSTHIDMVMGDLGPLATGAQRPEYQAHADAFRGVLEYSEVLPSSQPDSAAPPPRLPEDHPVITAQLRSSIAHAVGSVPKIGDGFRGGREPGRYEVAIVDRNSSLVPVFVDAQPDYLLKGNISSNPYALPETGVWGADAQPWVQPY